jgi:hypothetical protein
MKKPILSALALGAAGLLLSGLNASAVLIKTITYGGHTYELHSANDISWVAAEAAAEADGGYLAVLSTTAEITSVYGDLVGTGFFQAVAGQGVQAWLGARPVVGTSTTDRNNWAWINGDAWTSEAADNFAAGEPNGDSEGLAINRYGTFQFNDEGGLVGGYIVEKNGVPDGGTSVAMLGMALAGIGAFRRKFCI